jgi:hypothetical protein
LVLGKNWVDKCDADVLHPYVVDPFQH